MLFRSFLLSIVIIPAGFHGATSIIAYYSSSSMSSYIPLLLIAIGCTFLLQPRCLYAEHDIEMTDKTEFHIEPDRDKPSGYTLYGNHSMSIKFLSKRSIEQRTFSIGESYYGTISSLQAVVDGTNVDKKDITYEYPDDEDVFLSDYKIHKVSFPPTLSVGQTATYSYNIDYKDIVYFPFQYLNNADYVKDFNITIHHPTDIQVTFDIVFPRDSVPYRIEMPDAKTTILSFANVEKMAPINYFPFNGSRAYIQIIARRGDTLLTPIRYPEFTRWYRTLFEQKPDLTPRYDTLLATRIAAAANNRAKVGIIHDYVRTTIRYIAEENEMNAIVPRAPSLVLDRGYGDCKDRAYLVASLARKYGIPNVYMALINTEPKPRFNGTHVFQYNHVICALDEGGRVEFFDPTHKYCAFGNIPESDIDRPALVLNPDKPREVIVPPANTLPFVEVAINADLNDPAHGKARITLRNSSLSSALRALDELHGMDAENKLSRIVTPNFQKISFDNFELVERQDTIAIFTAEADLSHFIIASTAKKYIPNIPFRTVESDILEREKDSFALYLPWRDNLVLSIDLATPGYAAETASVSLGNMQTTGFTASATSASDRVQLHYRYVQNTREFSSGSKQQFLAFCKDYFKTKKNMFVLTKAEK